MFYENMLPILMRQMKRQSGHGASKSTYWYGEARRERRDFALKYMHRQECLMPAYSEAAARIEQLAGHIDYINMPRRLLMRSFFASLSRRYLLLDCEKYPRPIETHRRNATCRAGPSPIIIMHLPLITSAIRPIFGKPAGLSMMASALLL